MLGPFTKPSRINPIITPNPAVAWEAYATFNPAAVVRDGKIYVLYRAEDNSGAMTIGMHTSRLGLAESDDGIHFTRHPDPVFYPARPARNSSGD